MSSHNLGRSTFGKPENTGNLLTNEEALQLLNEWVLNERLRLHMHQVAHLMKSWAAEREILDEAGQRKWWQTGLLHDADWDQCRRSTVAASLKSWNAATWIPS